MSNRIISVKTKSRFSSFLFWSVVSAAFIGPGTVTTAASAGASVGISLIWALVFATVSCIFLQEAAARITILSGLSLGAAIRKKFAGGNSIILFIFVAILLGGIAYQAGNILGATAGIALVFNINEKILATLLSIVASILLWFGNYQIIAKIMGVIVAVMGAAFIFIALQLDISWISVAKSAIIPAIPTGASWLVIGLIGTTIVPYNLFLASGISGHQDLGNMRFGMVMAIIIGGLISMAILLVGSGLSEEFSFQSLQAKMVSEIGNWGGYLLAFGLFAAGFTSAVTAPLAAAITGMSLFKANSHSWQENKRYYKLTWILVMLAGLFFSVLGFKPIPVIILAQALNGILLPISCVFLLIIINDPRLINRHHLNKPASNLLMILIIMVIIFLGYINISKVIDRLLLWQANIYWVMVLAVITIVPIYFYIIKTRNSN